MLMGMLVAAFVSILPTAAGADDQSCFYTSKTGEGSAMFFDDCGAVTAEGDLELTPEHLENVAYDNDGLACVGFSAEQTYLLHESGHSHQVLWYDNWCDYFEEGLTRGVAKEKIVFVDKKLEVKVETDFEWAGHFSGGFALVCNGPFAREQHGEHFFTRGGSCGMIDKDGTLVVPAEHPLENIDVIRNLLEAQRN